MTCDLCPLYTSLPLKVGTSTVGVARGRGGGKEGRREGRKEGRKGGRKGGKVCGKEGKATTDL